MKKFLLTIAILIFAVMAATSQDYTYTLRKTMSTNTGSTDYSFYNFSVSSFSAIELVKGDTLDLNVAVDMGKDTPSIPSLELKFANESGSTDSLYISGTVKGQQFHLLTSEPTTGLALKTITSTKINMSTTNPYYYVIADSTNTAGFVIPKSGVNHLRSVRYELRLIPKGTSDTLRITGVRFKSWVNPQF